MNIPSRQVHFDFHTSELIENIGANFTKENYKEAIKLGHVNSMTIFAKCHHGYCYYPTKIGTVHPHLKFDLLQQQIEALHECGARAPIYMTVGWSALDGEVHPEWQMVDADTGMRNGTNYDMNAGPETPKPYISWKDMCINGPYGDYVLSFLEEICDNYEVDGFFLDIMLAKNTCVCDSCKAEMIKRGYNPKIKADAERYLTEGHREFMQRVVDLTKSKHPDATVYFNGSSGMYTPEYHEYNTHFELEDLPTTWGGYDKMPIRAKYCYKYGKPYVGQTGKFHTSWGEFGGFKNPDALKYEVAAMLTYGARCEIGDQLHPLGHLDMETYRITGHAFEYVEQIEDYCFDVVETTRLGVIASGDFEVDEGITRILLESKNDFDLILPDDDISNFDVIILPDVTSLTPKMAQNINEHIKKGKGLLLSGRSAVADGKFAIDFGAKYLGKSEYDTDYIVCNDQINHNLVKSPDLLYGSAHMVDFPGAEVLANVKEPYFSRTYGHYCSHQNTPYKPEDAAYPAIAKKGNVVYIAHELCRIYYQFGCLYHRDAFVNSLNTIYKNPVMRVKNLPSAGRCRFAHKPSDNRYVLHLLYGSPILRGCALVLEDFPVITDVECSLEVSNQIKSVTLRPQNTQIPFAQNGNRVEFTLGKFSLHQLITLEY